METAKLQELRDLIYDWRIHLNIPIGLSTDFQIDPKDDEEISELVNRDIVAKLEEQAKFDEEDSLYNIDDEWLESDNIESDDDFEFGGEDYDADIDDFSNPLPDYLKKMAEKQKKIKETEPDTIIQFDENLDCDLGFYVFEDELFVVDGCTDFPVAYLSEETQEKIYSAIKKKFNK